MLKLNSSSLSMLSKLLHKLLKLPKPLRSRKQNPRLLKLKLKLRKLSSPTITTSIRRAMLPLHLMRRPPSRRNRVAGSWPSS